MKISILIAVTSAIILITNVESITLAHPKELKDLGLTAPLSEPHEYALTNRKETHWTGEINKSEERKWQGLVKFGWCTLSNFWLDFSLKQDTSPKDLSSTMVYPHAIEFNYGQSSKTNKAGYNKNIKDSIKTQDTKSTFTETAFLPRDLDALVIHYDLPTSFTGSSVFFRPVVGMKKNWDLSTQGAQYDFSDDILFITSKNKDYKGPKFLAIGSSIPFKNFQKLDRKSPRKYTRDVFRHDGGDNQFALDAGKLEIVLSNKREFEVVAVTGDTKEEVTKLVKQVLGNVPQLWKGATDPLIQLLNKASIETKNERWAKALDWTLVSLDSLTMNIVGRGIYAGLHWFDQYWGRDSFISFPGALLTTGNFEMAKNFIRTMAANQNKNISSENFGRVPNILQAKVENPNYETTDGTAWFIRAIWILTEYSGIEKNFLQEIWPAVNTAIIGELKRTDRKGFLTHGDRETWMDGQYENNICSPRGNRAVEIQALWFTELDVASRIATILEKSKEATEWKAVMENLRKNFTPTFLNKQDGDLYDHIKKDGSPDLKKRPNQIYALTVPLSDNPLIIPEIATSVLRSVVKTVVAPHGIRTLTPSDPFYHPLHDYGSGRGDEHHDWSYHNGDVWPFLSGPVIEAALRYGDMKTAAQLTNVFVERTLTRDTLGTGAEIMDGAESKDDPLGHSRGAISQAWSLAEFMRSWHQNWMGIRPQASKRILELDILDLPNDLATSSSDFKFAEGIITVQYLKNSQQRTEVKIVLKGLNSPLDLVLRHPTSSQSCVPNASSTSAKADQSMTFDVNQGSNFWFKTLFKGIQNGNNVFAVSKKC